MIRNLFLAFFTLILSISSYAQNDTWAQLEFDFDGYASEVTWTLEDSYSATVASGGPYYDGLNDTIIFIDSLVSGNYTLTVNDSWSNPSI